MAHNPQRTGALAQFATDSNTSEFNSGYWRLYTGTQLVGAGSSVTSQVMLVEGAFGALACNPSDILGVGHFNPITPGVAEVAGVAKWALFLASDHFTQIACCSVGVAGYLNGVVSAGERFDIEFSDDGSHAVTVALGITVTLSAFTFESLLTGC